MNSPYNEDCIICGTEFDSQISGVYYHRRSFCCQRCYDEWIFDHYVDFD